MATYTVTRVTTRPNTSVEWPGPSLSTNGYADLVSSGKVTISYSYDSDNLVQTSTFVWASKADHLANRSNASSPDSTFMASRSAYNTYMADNNITARITEEDGTVRVFNSSSKNYEAE